MHIGLIGGIGPAATEYYYRGLIERHAAAGTQLELTIAHADVREMGKNLASGDAQKPRWPTFLWDRPWSISYMRGDGRKLFGMHYRIQSDSRRMQVGAFSD